MESANPQHRSLSVLVPVHNEKNRICPVLDELYARVLDELPDFEVLLLDNGSKDHTREVLAECGKTYRGLKAISSPARIGYRPCITFGFERASKERILRTKTSLPFGCYLLTISRKQHAPPKPFTTT